MRLTVFRRRWAAVATASILALGLIVGSSNRSGAGEARASSSLAGRWLTQDGDGVIEIDPCGAGFCGRIVGMSEIVRPDGRVPTDPHGTPQCGLTILRATGQDDSGVWKGRIENPADGTTWRCEIWDDPDGLHLRGYVVLPLLGQTQLWKHYAGRVGSDCRMLG